MRGEGATDCSGCGSLASLGGGGSGSQLGGAASGWQSVAESVPPCQPAQARPGPGEGVAASRLQGEGGKSRQIEAESHRRRGGRQ